MKQSFFIYISTIAVFFCLGSCQKEINFEDSTGSLQNNAGQCSPIIVSGTYYKEKPLQADSFYISVEVNITRAGPYTIKTNNSNGFMFSATGNFTTTGIQKVKLRPQGKPLKDTLTVFNCFYGNSACGFTIKVKDSLNPNPQPADLAINTWQFTDNDNGSFHYGIIDTTDTQLDTNLWNYFKITGWPIGFNTVTHDTMFLIALFLPRPLIETGTYNISSGIGGEHFMGFGNRTLVPPYGSNQNFCYYIATPSIAPGFTINIISYDSSKKLVKGSFNGTLLRRANITDYGGTSHTISGSFYCRLN